MIAIRQILSRLNTVFAKILWVPGLLVKLLAIWIGRLIGESLLQLEWLIYQFHDAGPEYMKGLHLRRNVYWSVSCSVNVRRCLLI